MHSAHATGPPSISYQNGGCAMRENRLLAASKEKFPSLVPSEPAMPSNAGTARTQGAR